MAKKWILGFVILVILTASVYVLLPDKVRIDVENTKTVFRVYEDGSWVLAGTERTIIYDGTKKMRANFRVVNYTIDGSSTTIYRYAYFKDNITAIDTYLFDGTTEDVEMYPVNHNVQILNGDGKIFVYEVKNLLYTGETIKDILSPQSFGHKMKVEWEEGNYYSKIYKYLNKDVGKLTIKYRIDSSNFSKDVRLFDPDPLIEFSSVGTRINNSIIASDESVIVNVTVVELNSTNITFYLYNDTALVNSTTFLMDDQTSNNTITYTNASVGFVDESNYTFNVTICDVSNNCNSTESRIFVIYDMYDFDINITTGFNFSFYNESDLQVQPQGQNSTHGIFTFENNLTINGSIYVKLNETNENITLKFYSKATKFVLDGLVGYWPFNIDARDISDNKNDGAYNGEGAFNFTGGNFSGAYAFDGVTNYIDVGNDSSLNFGTGEITISAWIKGNSSKANQFIYSKETDVSSDEGVILYLRSSGSIIRFEYWNSTDGDFVDSTQFVNDGNWHHVVAVRNSTNNSIYVDGNLSAMGISENIDADSSGSAIIGLELTSPTTNFNGSIDETRVYNRSLTQSEIDYLFANNTVLNSTGLVSHWAFNEKSGLIASDSVGSNDGDVIGGVFNLTNGILFGSYEFDGIDDYMDLGNASNLNFGSGEFTISAWVKINSIPALPSGGYTVYSRENVSDSTEGVYFGVVQFAGGGIVKPEFSVWNGTTTDNVSSSQDLNDNSWHHIVGVRNSTNISIYIDGIFNVMGISENVDGDTTDNASIGVEVSYNYFNGSIDEVRVYNRALNSTEISQLAGETPYSHAVTITTIYQEIYSILKVGETGYLWTWADYINPKKPWFPQLEIRFREK